MLSFATDYYIHYIRHCAYDDGCVCFIFHVHIIATLLFHSLILCFRFICSALYFCSFLPYYCYYNGYYCCCCCHRAVSLFLSKLSSSSHKFIALLCAVIALVVCASRAQRAKEPPFKSIFLAPNIAAIFSSLLYSFFCPCVRECVSLCSLRFRVARELFWPVLSSLFTLSQFFVLSSRPFIFRSIFYLL